jgi:glutathione S-transferase
MLKASPKGTVPVLVISGQMVLEESWDIMQWALSQNDPQNLLGQNGVLLDLTRPLVAALDGDFKTALDQYKYADRHPQSATYYRQQGLPFLNDLEARLGKTDFLLGNQISIADIAVMPFVRQYAHVDRPWFDQCGLNHLIRWLDLLIDSDLFHSAMEKYPLWEFHSA